MIHIFTSVVNRPDFVSIQDDLFKKFIVGKYKFHVIDDSIDKNISEQFRNICQKRKIEYYKTPEYLEHNNPSTKVGNVIQWSYDNLIKNQCQNDIVFWTDSDMFLIDKFDIENYMSDCVIAGLPQPRKHIKYMWNGLMFFNMPKLLELDPDIRFNIDFIDGQHLDTGGETYHYFKKNNLSMKETNYQYPSHYKDIDLQKDSGGYNMELHLDGKFLHYRAASNWYSNWRGTVDPLSEKTKIFYKIIESIFSE